jgi:acetyl-CoA carboxylase biotin carboxyl carrier protein
VGLSDDDVREILRIIAESPLEELRLETEGFSLYVRRGPGGAPNVSHEPEAPEPEAPEPEAPEPEAPERKAREPESAPPTAERDGAVAIEAPMLGTFYRAPGPGEDPFVDVGSTVEADSTVCIIEVMKMMNSVPAGVAGEVVEVAAENGQLVEYGEPLFYVRPR